MTEIPGYNGRYAIKEDGTVWKRNTCPYSNCPHHTNENGWKLIKSRKGWYDYTVVNLIKPGRTTHMPVNVHRLLAITFLPNPLNLPLVNHKDGCKDNPRLENLEWVTASQNTAHAYRTGLTPPHGRRPLQPKVKTNSLQPRSS